MPSFLSANLDTSWLKPSDNRELVPRARLLDRLQQSKHRAIRALVAPDGAGKTTLLQQYYSLQPAHCAWMSLQPEDASANCFFQHLTHVVRQVLPEFNGPVLCHEFNHPDRQPHLFYGLFYHTLAQLEAPLTIIVDDFHILETAPWRPSLLAMMSQAPNVRWIVATHSRHALQTDHTLPADCDLITHDALYFSHHELQQFLSKNARHQVFNQRIMDYTLGWPAGVKLAQLCLNLIPYYVADDSLSGRALFNQLLDTLLEHLDEQAQRFLTQTAFLGRFNADLCQQVVKGLNCEATIQTLVDTRFLIEIKPEHPLCYHYNPLVREKLLARFKALPEEDQERLVASACTWLTEHHYRLDGSLVAAHHPHPTVQVEYFLKNLVHWLRSGNLNDLFQRHLSHHQAQLTRLPQAKMAWCWLLAMSGRVSDSANTLQALLAGKDLQQVLSDPQDAIEANCAVAYGIIQSQQGRVDEQLLAQLKALTRHDQIYTSLRAPLNCLIAEVELEHLHATQALETIAHTKPTCAELKYEYTLCVANQIELRTRYLNNELDKALTLSQALQHEPRRFPHGVGAALLQALHGFLVYRNHDREAGYQTCLQGGATKLHWLHGETQSQLYQVLIQYWVHHEEYDLADALLTYVDSVAQDSGSPRFHSQVAVERFRLLSLTQQAQRASEYAIAIDLPRHITMALDEQHNLNWTTRYNWLVSGVLFHQLGGDTHQALHLASRLQALNLDLGYPIHLLTIALLEPWLEYQSDLRTSAFIKLDKVLNQIAPQHIYNGLLDDIPGISTFINHALREGRIQSASHREALARLGYHSA